MYKKENNEKCLKKYSHTSTQNSSSRKTKAI